MYVSAMKIRNTALCKHLKVFKVSLRYGTACGNNGQLQSTVPKKMATGTFTHNS